MTRHGRTLVAGGVVTLLLGAWVSATGPVAIFARQDLTNGRPKARGIDYGVDSGISNQGRGSSTTLPGQEQPLLVAVLQVAAKILLALVVLAVLVAVVRELLRWWAAREQPTTTSVDDFVVPEVLLRGAKEGEELLSVGSPANAVVAAWVALEGAARTVGVRDDVTRTSEELVTAVLRSYAVDRTSLDRLAALYREARFSAHPVGEDMRTSAREALQQIQAELRRATPRRQPDGTTGAARPTGRVR